MRLLLSVRGLAQESSKNLLTEREIRGALARNPWYRGFWGREILWNALRNHGLFQVWTKEFIESFASYLRKIISDPDAVILDVGAGNGLLTFWLSGLGLRIIAVDNQSWPLWSEKWKVRYPEWVLKMDYKEALRIFSPEIVISSWMPPYVDWTIDFRACDSVKEYILIGEVPKPPRIRPHNTHIVCVCGEWESWDEFPGWEKQELRDLTKLSTSYFELLSEKETEYFYHKSKVAVFKRISS